EGNCDDWLRTKVIRPHWPRRFYPTIVMAGLVPAIHGSFLLPVPAASFMEESRRGRLDPRHSPPHDVDQHPADRRVEAIDHRRRGVLSDRRLAGEHPVGDDTTIAVVEDLGGDLDMRRAAASVAIGAIFEDADFGHDLVVDRQPLARP